MNSPSDQRPESPAGDSSTSGRLAATGATVDPLTPHREPFPARRAISKVGAARKAAPRERGRRPELDGVRGVAILLVLLGHGLAGPVAAAGVTLFFGLSGYLITGILLKERERTGRLNLKRFYARRLTRLAPPLLLVVGLMGLARGGLPWDSWLPPLTWTSNYARLFNLPVYLFAHTWSLAVEEQFYIVWPLALLLVLGRRRPVVALSTALALLLVWRVVLLAAGEYSYAYTAFETAGSTILAGCLVALAGWEVRSNLVVLACIALLVVIPGVGWLLGPNAWYWVPLVATPMVAIVLAGARHCPWLTWRWLGFLGIASYSLYLWHEPIAFSLVGEARMTPLGVAAGAGAGLVAYVVVERPLMRWRDRLAR